MLRYKLSIYGLVLMLSWQACKPVSTTLTLNPTVYNITANLPKDAAMSSLLQPYTDSVQKSMGEVIGFSTQVAYKKQPESGLGNFMADAMQTIAQEHYQQKVDLAFVNFGGIRSYLPKGNITLGTIYQLMPFDNLVVLQKITGKQLQVFLNHISSRKGWPVSKGLAYKINAQGNATDILINNTPLNDTAVYTIANSDYVANGGDNSDMLKSIPQINKNLLMRTALLQYVKMQTAQGNAINCKTENRVTNE